MNAEDVIKEALKTARINLQNYKKSIHTSLKSTDKKLLSDAMKSNGGGVDSEMYPEATVNRLLKRGLVQWKPNQQKSRHFAQLLTLTKTGRIEADAIEKGEKG